MKKFVRLFALLALLLIGINPAFAVRQTQTVKTPPSLIGTIAADAADLTFTAADATNFEQCTHTGREMVVVYNSGAGARTCTFTSVADQLGRTGDITAYSLAAGEYGVFGPFPVTGWRQTTGYLYFAGSHAEIKFAVIQIPTFFTP